MTLDTKTRQQSFRRAPGEDKKRLLKAKRKDSKTLRAKIAVRSSTGCHCGIRLSSQFYKHALNAKDVTDLGTVAKRGRLREAPEKQVYPPTTSLSGNERFVKLARSA
jgi:hypothetical protein